MTLKDEILDVLADDGESIVQIRSRFEYYELNFSDKEIIDELSSLLRQGKIKIAYPYSKKGSLTFDIENIEDYWFELTNEGRKEQQSLKLEE